MTEFLVRKFVKNYECTEDLSVRTSYGVLSGCVGIFCNVLLFVVKLVIGMLMHSIAVMADAFNNLSDAASSVISFVGVKMAEKPADREHPFGHGRVEYIAAFIVAFLVMEVGLSFFKTSIDKFRNPEALVFEPVPFIILALSVGVKLWMAYFNKKLGKRIQSQVMLATAADSLGDVVTTSATLVSILIFGLTGWNVDAIAGLLVSLVVMWAGFSIAKDTLKPLIGQEADPELVKRIKSEVEGYDGIVGTHDLIIHSYGPGRSMASLHAEVPREVDIETSHEIIDRIEHEVSRKLGIFLVIHMDPVETHDQKYLELKAKMKEILDMLDPEVTFHDFRVVWGQERSNLIFDIQIPFSYGKEQEERIKNQIGRAAKLLDERYECVITVDKSYLGGIM